MQIPVEVTDLVRHARVVTVLTGAGMSAESGVPTFRDARSGLWERFDVERLATMQGWLDDPELVWAWYAWRMTMVRGVRPNAGHQALAAWSRRADVRIVTQNIDDLHERAGSQVLTHLHGSLYAPRCADCDMPYAGPLDLPVGPVERVAPPACDCGGLVRPGVVWFGEVLPAGAFELAEDSCRDSDLVVVVGTSGIVYPAAALPDIARGAGVPVVEINPVTSELTERVDHWLPGTAATVLPVLVGARTDEDLRAGECSP